MSLHESEGGHNRPSSGGFGPNDGWGGPSVLVIERSASTRELMWSVLRSEYQVQTAATYEEGLRRARAEAYVGIVMSLYPQEEGRGGEMLAALRDTDAHEAASIIAVCGPSLGRDRVSLLSDGFDDVLRMPFTQSDLLTVLDRMVGSD